MSKPPPYPLCRSAALKSPTPLTDPTIEHIVTIERENATPLGRKRVTCACGLDLGWQSPIVAIRTAAIHRVCVLAAKLSQGIDDVAVPLIERKHDHRAHVRWCCDSCPAVGAWVPSEAVASVGSILHADVCPRMEGR